ncbi:MAG TPA: AarF/UbiB family protein [Longimicrobiales bacterium]|nr:AarF/UbiB family protein [Longimicrobiales bacterium]
MRRWRRGTAIFLRLTPFVVAFLRDRHRWVLFGAPRKLSAAKHRRRAERLTRTIARLGPTFIKLAQVFGARADILPEPYLTTISTLQDQVPPDRPEAIRSVIEAEEGVPVDTLFSSFEDEPVATASLGQVHRAQRDGRTVAVKVLRPGVEELIAVDLEISYSILFGLNLLFSNDHHVKALTSVVREFAVKVRAEMDFRQEAEHLERFRHHFAGDGRVRAPETLEALTRRRVLVMEWVDGDKIDALAERIAAGDISHDRLMATLIEVYLRMLLVQGFLHADPHPGNLLVDAEGRIVFLDWGMVVPLRPATRERIVSVALATARQDTDGMINGMYELGMIDPDISRAEIRDAAAEILGVVERARELGVERVQEIVGEIMDTFYTWPLVLPRELVYFFRAAALLEGIGFRYNPEFNGIKAARPVVLGMRGELLHAAGREPAQVALNLVDETRAVLGGVRDVVRRAEREELRVRMHPRDLLRLERLLLLQSRRVLFSIFALTIALIASITFIAVRNVWLLLTGIVVALIMFVVTVFIPMHLLESPLRHARGVRPGAREQERLAGPPPAPSRRSDSHV